jgi:hypothetical protein
MCEARRCAQSSEKTILYTLDSHNFSNRSSIRLFLTGKVFITCNRCLRDHRRRCQGCSERFQTQVQRCAETIYTHGLEYMWSHRQSRFMSFESGKTSLHQPSDGIGELTGALLAPHLPNLTTRKCPFLTRPTAQARASAVTLMVNFVKDGRISCNLSERHCPVL